MCSDGGLVDRAFGALESLGDYIPQSIKNMMGSSEVKDASSVLGTIDHATVEEDLKDLKLNSLGLRKLRADPTKLGNLKDTEIPDATPEDWEKAQVYAEERRQQIEQYLEQSGVTAPASKKSKKPKADHNDEL